MLESVAASVVRVHVHACMRGPASLSRRSEAEEAPRCISLRTRKSSSRQHCSITFKLAILGSYPIFNFNSLEKATLTGTAESPNNTVGLEAAE